MTKKVIALIGMGGAGKSEAINYLQKKYKWPKVYFGSVIFDRLEKDGLEINWKNEKMIREKIRKELGMGACAILSLPKIQKLLKESDVVLAESLYSWDEYKILKNKYKENFKTIAIFTPRDIRFERLSKREHRPTKTIKAFNDRDYTEIEGTDKGGPIAVADYTIINDSDLTKLNKSLNKIIKLIVQ